MRRATGPSREIDTRGCHTISIHALHEESDGFQRGVDNVRAISIHALHEESDGRGVFSPRHSARFQSTLSMRRATIARNPVVQHQIISIHALHEESDRNQRDRDQQDRISIHALHEESDGQGQGRVYDLQDFNPRSP